MTQQMTNPKQSSLADTPRKARRRWEIWICLVLVLLPLIYFFDIHLIVIGYLRNEPCYRWRPAAYWKAQIQSRYRWLRNSDEPLTHIAIAILIKIKRNPYTDYSFREGDRRALPVLLFLIKDSDADVRSDAVFLLGMIDPPDERTMAAIIEALDDEDFGVRLHSLAALRNLGPSARGSSEAHSLV